MAVLTEVEQRLGAAAEAGETLDLRAADDREVRAEVVRDLLLAGGPELPGVRLHGARVVGRLDLEGRSVGTVLGLVDCDVTDLIWLRGSAFALLDLRRSRLVGLNVTESLIERVLLLDRIEVADGRVDLDGARIGAACSLRRARVRNGSGPALVASRLRLSSELLLDDMVVEGSCEDGAFRLLGARVDGRVSARRLHATNADGPALVADNLQVTDMVDLSGGAVLRGRGDRGALRLVGARMGSLSLGGARLESPDGWALAAHYLDVGGTLYLDRIRAVGGIRVSGSRIGGQLTLEGAVVDGAGRQALAATRVRVAQATVLDDATLRAAGEQPAVDLRSARIAGDLELRHTRLSNPVGPALRLNTATVEGRAVMSELVVEHGGVDLRDSTVGALYDDPASAVPADGWVEVNGLVYRGVPGHPGVTVAERLAWLRRMPGYAAQPYRQVAAAYQAAGHEQDSRRVLIAQQRHLAESGRLAGWSLLRHRLLGLTLGYGYQTWRAVVGLTAVVLVAVALFLGLAGGTMTGPAGTACPAVDRIGLAIDTAVPLVQAGAGDRCGLATGTAPGRVLAVTGWGITLLGWGFASLVVAGYTGLVRRS